MSIKRRIITENMRRQIRLVFHTETGAGPAGQRRGHTPKPQQPQGTEKSTRHTNHKCSTSLATERSLGAVEGALVIIRNPSQLIMFLFLSEQHSDTGVTDSSRAATHLTTGLEGSRVHCKQTLGGPRGEDQRCDATWRGGGGPPNACLCPCSRTQQHPKPHSPLPFCLVSAKAGHLLCLGVFHELTQVFPAAHIHLTTATTAKQVRLTPCLRI